MDALQNVRVKIDKHHACRRVVFESPNRVSFTFDRLKTGAEITNIEISGLRQQYECFGKMVVNDAVVHVREPTVNGKIVVTVGGIVDFFTAVLKNDLDFIKLNVYVTTTTNRTCQSSKCELSF
ncbi:etm [Anticarsia gemmatalis multiple nucleopolyhedrovirus]|uniref:Etm n=1 Tax=Anticarsia gemmatalis multiple nucleopolyhedrovirus TaxID=268591 RepID=A0A0S3IWV2_9ABAC|nr:etm [Anticarsia gemmatalis multiple nucleopolyhedrovirus]YP_803444.1 etm [Anticarsia gemmatalis nucleopolyhedrovirus]ABI13834.1 etm [Anticarsia gemmatalis multiple nucleopolyhedrovirus]ALR69918.1 etm [Anticarsia gemmatalis multiple nucleopolyhedrovirus]ALR70076.1 etm [Anticarsia gemmatalis multiple nucleopolyhedrovirus]ALR70233.1 etm [Anticarsia gemmatalis multiple nucleopolyhedrovirus]ALR70390.1 etm [Anticarsia gemmatalis multiple nucleopolyhedrovirus]